MGLSVHRRMERRVNQKGDRMNKEALIGLISGYAVKLNGAVESVK